MSNNRFANLFGLSEADAIVLLDTPIDQLGEEDSRYVAAAQLAYFPSEASIQALIRAVYNNDPAFDNKITRRKAVESLGKLKAQAGLAAIRTCLADTGDTYTIENTAWSIGEIGTQDPEILETLAQLLELPEQTYRIIIHTLGKLDYKPALARIQKFVDHEDRTIASAAIATIYRLTGDDSNMEKVMEFLFHANVYTRRLSIQDLIDTKYYTAIPEITQTPVSMVFRMRGLRLLAETAVPEGQLTIDQLLPHVEQLLLDHPKNLQLVHAYDQTPAIDRLIRELYETDFGRAYLAIKTLIDQDPAVVGPALIKTYYEEAREDYGAHYHVMKLIGWIGYGAGYDILLEGLNVSQPQFQKSKAAAAIALGELGDKRAIEHLKPCLESKLWDLRYAALIALEKLGDTSGYELLANDSDWYVQARAQQAGRSAVV
ncbi:HEAT repeat domain-containing protein [filamentous cyanobacterium LEGE 11480]|uniref:HEAT repeat domain-containing protein n=1 Tax=Romeriopsis navalis LEGE 11480 TaxID=2777977 RepID=A0A928VJH9_9CYAN|nr:HEAT repeat domain-containing protein [Romeriopsis navalis]MBE9029773.1 HEAT repeat domain-containing protein [Romeriopsis navalis LEGE 11480]